MRRRKQQLTLGDLISTVSRYSRNFREASLVVADLTHRGIVRLAPQRKHIRIHLTH
jgi:hypothetical protein